jgi:hypothetical protein
MTDNTPAPIEEGAALPPSDVTFDGLKLSEHYVEALEAMAYEGLSLHLAAKKANIRPDNFSRTFNNPAVRRVYNQLLKSIRDNAGQQAYVRMVNLAQTSSSDHVRLEANKWIAGVDGIAALKRVEGRMQHSHTFGGFEYPEPEPVDVTPDDAAPDTQSDAVEE